MAACGVTYAYGMRHTYVHVWHESCSRCDMYVFMCMCGIMFIRLQHASKYKVVYTYTSTAQSITACDAVNRFMSSEYDAGLSCDVRHVTLYACHVVGCTSCDVVSCHVMSSLSSAPPLRNILPRARHHRSHDRTSCAFGA